MIEVLGLEIPSTFYPFLFFWASIWFGTKIVASKKEDHFDNAYVSTLNVSVGMTIAVLSLYFDDEEILLESTTISWFAAFFIMDLVDCINRRDIVFTIHAILSLGLCRINMTPKYYNLRMASQGSFAELSTPFLWRWKNTKAKTDFHIFGVIFFFCRLVWVPVFITKASRLIKIDDLVLYISGAFYLLQLGFFVKIIQILSNYKAGKGKQE